MAEPYLRLRQVCLTALHIESCTHLIQDLMGLSECHRDPGVAKYGLENILFPMGDSRFLEVVCPGETGPGTPAGRFLGASGGKGGYMLIFDCEDPIPRKERAEKMGVRIANHLDRPQFQGYQLHPKDTRACFLEFDHTKDGEDKTGPYWPAGGDWQKHVKQDVTHSFDAVEVLSHAPKDLADHWSKIMDVPYETRDGRHVFSIDEQDMIIAGAPGIERERLDAMVFTVTGAADILTRARYLGLETQPDAFMLCGVWFRLREAGSA